MAFHPNHVKYVFVSSVTGSVLLRVFHPNLNFHPQLVESLVQWFHPDCQTAVVVELARSQTGGFDGGGNGGNIGGCPPDG